MFTSETSEPSAVFTYAVLQQRVDGLRLVRDGELHRRHHGAAGVRRACTQGAGLSELRSYWPELYFMLPGRKIKLTTTNLQNYRKIY